jgi:Ger(x)C family germination protein
MLFLVIVTILFTQGCWGARETDDLGYVLVTGIDKGKENLIKVTFQIAVPQPLQGGKSEKVTEIVSVESSSLFGALNLMSSFISKDVTFIHNKAVVVSEELAREGLSRYINPLVRNRELRRTNYLLVAKGSASDFIEKNKELVFEKYPSRQMDLLMAASGFTGLTSRTDIHRFYQALKTPGIQPVAALVSAHKEEEKKTDEDFPRSALS